MMQIYTALLIRDPLLWLRVRQWLSDFREICLAEALESESIDLVILDQMPPKDLCRWDWILMSDYIEQSMLQNPFLFSAFDVIIEKDDSIRFHAAIEEYLHWKRVLQKDRASTQEEIDLLRCQRNGWILNWDADSYRFDHELLAGICHLFQITADHWWTTSEIADKLTVSKTTLRKYLEELEKRNKVRTRMRYGKGRPSREYAIQKTSGEIGSDPGWGGREMEKIVVATHNKGKMKEFRAILSQYEVSSMFDEGITNQPEENGSTFGENALIKARALAEDLKKKEIRAIAVADDSGLVVDALDGMPGIYSARYMGEDTSYDIKNAKILELLKDVSEEKRTARFVAAIAAVYPDGSEKVTEGTIEGRIAHSIDGENGFGYDPIFYYPPLNKTTAQLTPEEKNAVSHRGKALEQLKQIL